MQTKIAKLKKLSELQNLKFSTKNDVLTNISDIANRDSKIRLAKISNKFAKILFKQNEGIFEVESKVAATTINHVLFSPSERLPKKSILSVELI